MRNFSYENEFDLHENEFVGETHFHKNGFARRLLLTPRLYTTRKWSIIPGILIFCQDSGGLLFAHVTAQTAFVGTVNPVYIEICADQDRF